MNDRRVVFDFAATFSNGGGIQGQDFRLDVQGDEISDSDVEKSVAVHMLGTIWMCKAAWPHMTDAGYGRIINISSGGILGGSYLNVYGACKAGIFGLSRSLAVEGDPRGIVVNAFAPSATTAAIRHNTGGQGDAQLDWERHTPDIVAPALAYMAHEECTFTGKCVRCCDAREGDSGRDLGMLEVV